MSLEKNRNEALRWLRTARADLDSAVVLRDNNKYAHACFHAQQAGEKAIKAIWYWAGEEPWGHSLQKLLQDLDVVDLKYREELDKLIRSAMVLDRFYIPTRYPNGLPDLTPDDAYIADDATDCIGHATKILKAADTILESPD